MVREARVSHSISYLCPATPILGYLGAELRDLLGAHLQHGGFRTAQIDVVNLLQADFVLG